MASIKAAPYARRHTALSGHTYAQGIMCCVVCMVARTTGITHLASIKTDALDGQSDVGAAVIQLVPCSCYWVCLHAAAAASPLSVARALVAVHIEW